MVRNRKKKDLLFDPENMREAVKLIQNGRTIRSVARERNLKVPTLACYVKKCTDMNPDTARFIPNLANRQIFSKEQKDSLAEYLVISARMGYGLNRENTKKPSKWDKIKMPQKYLTHG